MNNSAIKETKFQIDFLPGRAFAGFFTGEYWNGFDCPRFTFEQAQDLVRGWTATGKSARYLESEDAFAFESIDDSEDSEMFVAEVIDGQKFYPIGANNWIWSEVESDE